MTAAVWVSVVSKIDGGGGGIEIAVQVRQNLIDNGAQHNVASGILWELFVFQQQGYVLIKADGSHS